MTTRAWPKGPDLAKWVLTWKFGLGPWPSDREAEYDESVYRLSNTWAPMSLLVTYTVHALCKQFIQCHSPWRMARHPPTDFTIQLGQYLGNRWNRPRYAAVIPLTLSSLLYYHRSPLYTQHIKCSNIQWEIPWHKYALTHTFHMHTRRPPSLSLPLPLSLSFSLTHIGYTEKSSNT